MRLNGEAVLTREGLWFPTSDAAHPRVLGVADNCRCWGIWLDTRDRRIFSASDGSGGGTGTCAPDERQFPHLIVSPLDERLWTSAFRMEAYLDRSYLRNGDAERDCVRTVQRFLNELSDVLGISTILTQGGIAGYDLFVLNAICELPKLRFPSEGFELEAKDLVHGIAAASEQEAESLRAQLQKLRETQMQTLARTMLPILAWFEARVRADDLGAGMEYGQTGFLHRRALKYEHSPWFLPDPTSASRLAEEATNSQIITKLVPSRGQEPRQFLRPIERLFEYLQAESRRREPQHRRGEEQDAMRAQSSDNYAAHRLEQLVRAHGVQPFSVRALLTLAYASVWRFPETDSEARVERPVLMRYSRAWGGFKFEDGAGAIHRFLNQDAFYDSKTNVRFAEGDEHPVITSFNVDHGAMRIRFVRQSFAQDRMRTIVIGFEERARNAVSTSGVLDSAIAQLTDKPFNLRVERILHTPEDTDDSHEKGEIRILVKVAGEPRAVNWQHVETQVRDSIQARMARPEFVSTVTSHAWSAESIRQGGKAGG